MFRTFCVQIGVPNIRVYEERELRRQQETLKRRFVFVELVKNCLSCVLFHWSGVLVDRDSAVKTVDLRSIPQ